MCLVNADGDIAGGRRTLEGSAWSACMANADGDIAGGRRTLEGSAWSACTANADGEFFFFQFKQARQATQIAFNL